MADIIPLKEPRASSPPPNGATNLACGADNRCPAIPYSALGNPTSRFDRLFDPAAFEAELYEQQLDAVRHEMEARPDLRGHLRPDRADAPGQGRMSVLPSVQPVLASKTESFSPTPFAAVSMCRLPTQ